MVAAEAGAVADWRLVVVTLNEGKSRIPADRLQAALLSSLSPEALGNARGVLVSRQEVAPKGDGASTWDKALAPFGFTSRLVEVTTKERCTRLAFYSRDTTEFELVSTHRSGATHGASAAVLSRGGRRLLLAAAHLDGNRPPAQRLAPIEGVLAEAVDGGGFDAAFAAGDFNFALLPTASALGSGVPSARRAAELLRAELKELSSRPEEQLVCRVSNELEEVLQEGLATPAGRDALAALDGCPAELQLPAELPGLRLQSLPAGAFPSYRLCNVENKAFEGFSAAAHEVAPWLSRTGTAAAGWARWAFECTFRAREQHMAAAQARQCFEDGWLQMDSAVSVTADTVHAAYFNDDDKGHAGAMKKRGQTCRFNLGWLDRLYVGTAGVSDARTGSELATSAIQSDPVFIVSEDGKTLDHAFVSWCVEVFEHGAATL